MVENKSGFSVENFPFISSVLPDDGQLKSILSKLKIFRVQELADEQKYKKELEKQRDGGTEKFVGARKYSEKQSEHYNKILVNFEKFLQEVYENSVVHGGDGEETKKATKEWMEKFVPGFLGILNRIVEGFGANTKTTIDNKSELMKYFKMGVEEHFQFSKFSPARSPFEERKEKKRSGEFLTFSFEQLLESVFDKLSMKSQSSFVENSYTSIDSLSGWMLSEFGTFGTKKDESGEEQLRQLRVNEILKDINKIYQNTQSEFSQYSTSLSDAVEYFYEKSFRDVKSTQEFDVSPVKSFVELYAKTILTMSSAIGIANRIYVLVKADKIIMENWRSGRISRGENFVSYMKQREGLAVCKERLNEVFKNLFMSDSLPRTLKQIANKSQIPGILNYEKDQVEPFSIMEKVVVGKDINEEKISRENLMNAVLYICSGETDFLSLPDNPKEYESFLEKKISQNIMFKTVWNLIAHYDIEATGDVLSVVSNKDLMAPTLSKREVEGTFEETKKVIKENLDLYFAEKMIYKYFGRVASHKINDTYNKIKEMSSVLLEKALMFKRGEMKSSVFLQEVFSYRDELKSTIKALINEVDSGEETLIELIKLTGIPQENGKWIRAVAGTIDMAMKSSKLSEKIEEAKKNSRDSFKVLTKYGMQGANAAEKNKAEILKAVVKIIENIQFKSVVKDCLEFLKGFENNAYSIKSGIGKSKDAQESTSEKLQDNMAKNMAAFFYVFEDLYSTRSMTEEKFEEVFGFLDWVKNIWKEVSSKDGVTFSDILPTINEKFEEKMEQVQHYYLSGDKSIDFKKLSEPRGFFEAAVTEVLTSITKRKFSFNEYKELSSKFKQQINSFGIEEREEVVNHLCLEVAGLVGKDIDSMTAAGAKKGVVNFNSKEMTVSHMVNLVYKEALKNINGSRAAMV